jgi:uncharacterized membrane protein YraQ (UPF0718 family)
LQGNLGVFKNILISILLEAIPFVLLGVLLAALLQMFVSEQMVRRWMPKHPALGILFGSVLGLLFPICECGMIPVIRRLMQKGMPVYIAVVFVISGPILNPIVFFSTYMAFRAQPEMAYARMGMAFLVAVAIGFIIWKTVKENPLKHTLGQLAIAGVATPVPVEAVAVPVVAGDGAEAKADADVRPAVVEATPAQKEPSVIRVTWNVIGDPVADELQADDKAERVKRLLTVNERLEKFGKLELAPDEADEDDQLEPAESTVEELVAAENVEPAESVEPVESAQLLPETMPEAKPEEAAAELGGDSFSDVTSAEERNLLLGVASVSKPAPAVQPAVPEQPEIPVADMSDDEISEAERNVLLNGPGAKPKPVVTAPVVEEEPLAKPRKNRVVELFSHASLEFFEMGKYLVLGCIITALVHTFVSRDLMVSVGDGALSSHLFMMAFAYILSICSTSDAFVASSFAMTFTSGSLLAFLVYGPMLDLKTTLMMTAVFRLKFVLYLMFLITTVVFIGSIIVGAMVF